jgi:hypothetical protein
MENGKKSVYLVIWRLHENVLSFFLEHSARQAFELAKLPRASAQYP